MENPGSVLDGNIPASAFNDNGCLHISEQEEVFAGNRFFTLSMHENNGNKGYCGKGFLKPEIIGQIDSKLDDGKPLTGVITAAKGSDHIEENDCLYEVLNKYNMGDKQSSCVIRFQIQH